MFEEYGFVLNFEELPEELLDEKFEEWKEYMKKSEPERIKEEDDEKLREEFEDQVSAHFPVYF